MALDKPFRLTQTTAPPAQDRRAPAPTPTEVEARSSGRNLRPLQDVARELRVPDRGAVLPWPQMAPKLPIRLG